MEADNKHTRAIRVASRGRLAAALCAFVTTAMLTGSAAHAADRIYWASYGPDGNSTNTISYANLDGSGGGNLATTGAPIDGPMGIAIDSASGRLYWANYGSNEHGTTLAFANADGSGGGGVFSTSALVGAPHGVAIDRGAGRIYWTNGSNSSIAYANLDGSGGGILDIWAANGTNPRGLAIDLSAGRLYWADHFSPGAISWANLDGTAGGDIPTGAATIDDPEGVAIDPATGRIYWGNFGPASSISYANLDGSGGGNLPTPGATPNFPHGVAIDPEARKIYWADSGPTDDGTTISYANLDGSGGGKLATGGATVRGPALPVLLKIPVRSGAPTIQGKPAAGSKLRCTRGKWAPDLLDSLLYRAPSTISYKWRRNGHRIAPHASRSLRARMLGDYRCVATAHNAAGTSSQASDPLAVFRIAKPQLDSSNGTARLKVTVPDPGKLTLASSGGRLARAASVVQPVAKRVRSGTVTLLVNPRGKARRSLRRTGRVKVKIKVVYKPKGEPSDSQIRTLRLKEGSRP